VLQQGSLPAVQGLQETLPEPENKPPHIAAALPLLLLLLLLLQKGLAAVAESC
jgi:hypothetical protein